MKTLSLCITIFFTVINFSFAQVGIGTTTPNENSMLDIQSTTKGFLPPRMTTTEKETLGGLLSTSNADKGMLVFDTTINAYYYWNGTTWSLLRVDTVETDEKSVGNIYLTTAYTTTLSGDTAVKIEGDTYAIAANMINFSDGDDDGDGDGDSDTDNRLIYNGDEEQTFSVVCSLSFNGIGNINDDVYSFYIAKGSPSISTAVLTPTLVKRYVSSNSDVGALSISGTVNLNTGEWIEVWASVLKSDGTASTDDLNCNTFNLLVQSTK